MSADDDVQPGGRGGWFMRAAGVVGDLGAPFYAEERQRDVWNEACAVGVQVALWSGLTLATAMVWLGGATGLPYAFAVFGLVFGVTSWVVVLYAERLGVRLDSAGHLPRLRLVPYLVLLVAFLVGVVRAAPADGFLGGVAQGAAVGGAAVTLWLLASGLRARRRTRDVRA
ncbi:hypothetical protein E4P41_07905 [Geodermatophilus sp. DF01-2]|uniref:hypothetical protein n=1 Tax=Geodermatophilus sp. DF01-2 TaxID=2559610 RepID=UPI0010735F42|nr:hypothetical protein [Geodermatophilus sp. DF01_2]TFV62278.1 hypothetical protein E4P41_07905 [Geodermatophilus sp. DF01_2]